MISKDFYKLLNNSFFRKTMENVRNRVRIEFIKNYEYEKPIKRQCNQFSMEFINHMEIVIIILSGRMKFFWINQFFKSFLY